jgi:hypothetical protein
VSGRGGTREVKQCPVMRDGVGGGRWKGNKRVKTGGKEMSRKDSQKQQRQKE